MRGSILIPVFIGWAFYVSTLDIKDLLNELFMHVLLPSAVMGVIFFNQRILPYLNAK